MEYHTWFLFQAVTYPSYIMKTNTQFRLSVEGLPKKIVTQKDKYDTEIRFIAGVNQHYMERHYYSQTLTEYGLYFHYKMFNVSIGGYSNHSDIKMNEDFLRITDAKVYFIGGDPALDNFNHTEEWISTID